MAGPMRDTFREATRIVEAVRESIAAAPARAVERVTNADIERALIAFVREYVRADAWEVIVPGDHTGGISHQGLLAVLASQGRDFLQSTVQLYQAVNVALRREYMGGGKLPSLDALKKIAGPALLDHIELRLSKRGNADIRTTPLTAEYAARKRRLGRGSQPIGVASGELRRAFSRNAKIRWKK